MWREGQGLRLDVNGASLEARCWGPPPDQAATLVLLHEGLGCVSLWRDFPQRLAAATGLGVFAYSRRGYGASDPAELPRPLDYMTREALDVLPLILDLIGLRSGLLIGHSDGASIAAIHAGRVCDPRIKALCLMAPHFFTEMGGLASIAAAISAYETTDLKARLGRHHTNPENTFRGWNDAWLHPDFKHWNISDVIADIAVPVLAIQGKDDQYGTMAQLDALEHGLKSPFTRLELADCQHTPHLEQPEKTLEEVTDWLIYAV
jgi:pimeloyl-ACP methyl ester carboxylesterase